MIEIKNLSKEYKTSNGTIKALNDVSLTINDGEIYGIIGMSGAGKSTLVRCMNYLEKPTSGQIIVDGKELGSLNKEELRAYKKDVGMIFQRFNLLMQSTCIKNVMFPDELDGLNKKEAEKRAHEFLKIVGLDEKANDYPAQLSGGQQQRIAIARALASNPKYLLCDEATSALDPQTTNSILDLIREINQKYNITVVVITHQMSIIEDICDKVAIIDNGEVVEEGYVSEVFSHPKSQAGKKLVSPEYEELSKILANNSQKFLRVVFNGAESTDKPLIASLARDKNVLSNIVYASINNINDKVFGSIMLGFNSKEDLETAKEYINSVENVLAKEFDINE